MRSIAVILLVLGCLLNQVAYQALPSDGDGNGAHIAAAQQAVTDVLLRSSELARLPRVAEALLAAYVVPEVAAVGFECALDEWKSGGGKHRPTLQTLDVRLQV